MSRPRIGVTGPRRGGDVLYWATRLALRRAGANAVRIRPGQERAPLDGYVIGGGSDIDARRYGDGQPVEGSRIDPERDELELSVLHDAEASETPVLGICRGAQLLNVSRGGTLHAELAELHGPRATRRMVFARKRVRLAPGSLVERVLGQREIRVNAFHHQGCDRVGRGLRAVGRDEWDIVQAIEGSDERFIVGVQWHPELLPMRDDSRRLFAALVARARVGADHIAPPTP